MQAAKNGDDFILLEGQATLGGNGQPVRAPLRLTQLLLHDHRTIAGDALLLLEAGVNGERALHALA
ncbi:hypothetical protein, partial [Collinsella aerofaciens]|uniref:hypothetical protein n=1 Tax=Collinsella aerofaciens TaxID=74426 RepID=UPI0039C49312